VDDIKIYCRQVQPPHHSRGSPGSAGAPGGRSLIDGRLRQLGRGQPASVVRLGEISPIGLLFSQLLKPKIIMSTGNYGSCCWVLLLKWWVNQLCIRRLLGYFSYDDGHLLLTRYGNPAAGVPDVNKRDVSVNIARCLRFLRDFSQVEFADGW